MRWLAIGLGGVLGLVVLALGSIYVLATTEGGRAWLTVQVERLLSTPGEFELAIGRLDGSMPHSLDITEVKVSDAEGAWLEAAAVRLDWRPLALFRRTLWIESIEVEGLQLARQPVAPPERASEPADLSPPSLPVRIVLEHLAIDQVTLDAPVLGVPASFRVLGQASTTTSDDLRASLLVERADGTAGRMEAQGHYRVSDMNLTLALSVDEPVGGLIARALQLPELPAVTARFDGDGPITAWRGHFALQLAGLARAEADIELSGETEFAFKLNGTTETTRAPTQVPWTLLAGRTSFDVNGSWKQPAVLAIERAQLENAAATLTLSGTLDLGSLEADAQAAVGLSDGRFLANFIEGAETDRLELNARLHGTLERGELSLEASTARFRLADIEIREPTVKILARRPLLEPELDIEVEASSLSAAPFVAKELTSRLILRPDQPLDRGSLVGSIEINGGARRLLVERDPDLQSLVGEEALDWEFRGRLDLQSDTLTADHLKLLSGQVTLSATGDLDLANGAAETKVNIVLADLARLEPLLGLELSGQAEANATVTARNFGERLEAKISGVLRALALKDAVAQALLTDQVTVAADIALEPQGRLVVEGLRLETRHARFAGTVGLSNNFGELKADYRLEVENLGVLGAALGQDLSGSAQAEGRAFGRVGNPRLSGTLVLEKPVIGGFELAGLRFGYTADDPAGKPHGEVTGRAATPVGEIAGRTDFRLDGSTLHLDKLNLEMGRSHVSGRAAIPLNGRPVAAQVKAQSQDLGPWLALAGISGAGSGTAEFTLSADQNRQAGVLSASLQDLSLRLEDDRSIRAGALTGRLESKDLLGKFKGTVTLTGQDVAAGDLRLETLSVDGSGGLDTADYRLAMAGHWLGPLDLSSDGRLALSGQQIAVDVVRLEGEILGQSLKSRQRFRITQAPNVLELVDADLAYGDARVTASARLGPGKLAADLAATNLSLAQLEPLSPTKGITGLIIGSLKISGTAKKPVGQVSLSVTDLKLGAVAPAPPGYLALSGDWRNGRLEVEGSLKGLAKQDAVFRAGLPLRLDPATLVPELPEREAITGSLTWRGEAAEIWPLVPTAGHDLKGRCNIDLSLGGTLAQPRFVGGMSLSDGEYESLVSGTLLRELELDLTLDGRRVMLNKLEAKDGVGGSLSAQGEFEIAPERSFPLGISAKFDRFLLLRRDDVTAAAGGDLTLTGSLQGGSLTGQLESRGVEIRIPDRLPSQVVELDVVEAGTEGQALQESDAAAVRQRRFQLALDLGIAMPNRVFVRGRGLDSEWAGKLEVGGTSELPVIKGKIALVRGQVSVVGQTFKLEEGTIDFLGGEKIDPLIDVKAISQKKDLQVTVRVHGPAVNPEIDLSSDPVLPRDEIVSRMLFGKSTTQLSALEAVQLAAAVAELSGAAGSRSFLDIARGKLGIDVLRVESVGEGDETTPAVSAGKYVSEDIYLGVKQGTTAESGSVEVEVELTPNISLKSEVGQTGQSNLGVRFKWDY